MLLVIFDQNIFLKMNSFSKRHIGINKSDKAKMLDYLNVRNIQVSFVNFFIILPLAINVTFANNQFAVYEKIVGSLII